jgi:hypothetical protein
MEFSSNKYSVQTLAMWILIFFFPGACMYSMAGSGGTVCIFSSLKECSESDMKIGQSVLLQKISKNTFRKGIFFPFNPFVTRKLK